MPVVSSDISINYSGGASNSNPDLSLGGARSSVAIQDNIMNNMFDDVQGAEVINGDTEYRCFYIKNNNATISFDNVKVWISQTTPALNEEVQLGLGTAAKGATEQSVANENTVPPGVTFIGANTVSTALDVGSLGGSAGTTSHKAIWIKRTVNANAAPFRNNYFVLRIEGVSAAGASIGVIDPVTIQFNSLLDNNTTGNLMIDLAEQLFDPNDTAGNLFLFGGDGNGDNTQQIIFDITTSIDDQQGGMAKFRWSLGNHDAATAKTNAIVAKYGTTNSYFSFDIRNVHVLVLDSEHTPNVAPQSTFATSDLAAAKANTAINWIIVVMHRPFYTVQSADADEASMRTTYAPLFDTNDVDIVLEGEQHNIERTYPCRNNAHNNPTIVTNTAGPYNFATAAHGSIYVINGSMGAGGLNAIVGTAPFNVYTNDNTYMNFLMKTSNNGKTMTCQFVDQNKTIKHQFVINK